MRNADGAVIVTGGGGAGCGRQICLRFARHGAPVVVADVNAGDGDHTVRQVLALGGRAKFFPCDVKREEDVREMMALAEASFGSIRVLVNNASAPHGDDDLASWNDALATDLMGSVYATRWAVEAMKRRGSGAIVNVASISAMWHGRKSPGGFAGYDVAKAAMIRMTTRLASLAVSHRIRVNCLAPGWIGTEGVRKYWESLSPEERVKRGVPSKLLSVADVSGVVVRLAEDETLAGRVVVWWSEDQPRLIEWGDRGYQHASAFSPGSDASE